MINVKDIPAFQMNLVQKWHNDLTFKCNENEIIWTHIEENMFWNFMLWHEEDIARIVDINPERIVEAKRKIDKYNQNRNNSMEKIDEWILVNLIDNSLANSRQLHSETPGMMIDRLSIMNLKLYHMNEEVLRIDATYEHKEKCAYKVNILNEQISDLIGCLDDIYVRIKKGSLGFKVYRQFKMYNDPMLNPQLYKNIK